MKYPTTKIVIVAQLQAKALEILRGRTVAEDDESCPVFNLTPESYNPCKGEPK
jgi:hypothetical protein